MTSLIQCELYINYHQADDDVCVCVDERRGGGGGKRVQIYDLNGMSKSISHAIGSRGF